MKIKILAILFVTVSIIFAADLGEIWQAKNIPGRVVANITSIAMTPDGSKIITNGGSTYLFEKLYLSTNGGSTWVGLKMGLANSMTDVAMSDNGQKIVAFANGDGVRFYVSLDGGTSWVTRNLNVSGEALIGCRIAGNGSKMVVFTSNKYLYISNDDGQTWTRKLDDAARNWYDVAISYDGSKMAGVCYSGYIYLSNDGGETWTQNDDFGFGNWSRVALSNDGSVLAAAKYQGDIMVSDNAGIRYGGSSDFWYAIDISDDGSKIIAGNRAGNMIYSTDNGNSWDAYSNANPGTWNTIKLSSNGQKIVASGELFQISNDNGKNWTTIENLSYKRLFNIAASNSGNKLYVSSQQGYIYVSNDSGNSWVEKNSLGIKMWCGLDTSADGTKVFAAGYYTGNGVTTYDNIYYSNDSGGAWQKLTSSPSLAWLTLAVSDDGQKIAAAPASGYIWISNDGGTTWQQNNAAGSKNWKRIAMSGNGQIIVALVASNYMYISMNGGTTWTEITSLGTRSWNDVAISTDGTKIACAYGQYFYYGSYDGSAWNWSLKHTNTTNLIYGVALSDDGLNLAYGPSGGYIFTSKDNGTTWTVRNNAPKDHWYSLTMTPDGKNLFAANYYTGSKLYYSSSTTGGGGSGSNYSFNKIGDEVTYTANKNSKDIATIKMAESKLGLGTITQTNFSDVIMNITPQGKPSLVIPNTNPIAATVNASHGAVAVTASFTGLPKQIGGKIPAIMMNGKQITDTKGNVFPAYTAYVKNVTWDNNTGTLTFLITHFTEYGIPVLVGKTFTGTAVDQAINANGADIVVNYSTGSVAGDFNHDRTTTILGIHGLAYETVLTDAPVTLNNLYRSLVPGQAYGISFEYINRGNAIDDYDIALDITKQNNDHYDFSSTVPEPTAPWQVVSCNVYINPVSANAFERATLDVTIYLNGITGTSYNAFEDAYLGGTYGNDGQYGGVTNFQHRFVLEAEGYSISILNRAITVNAPLNYTGSPVSLTNLIPGAKVTYTIVLKNNNNSVATSVNLTDIIPDNCHLYYTEVPAVEGAALWAWRGATDNTADKNTNNAVKYEITIPAQGRVTASYTVTVD